MCATTFFSLIQFVYWQKEGGERGSMCSPTWWWTHTAAVRVLITRDLKQCHHSLVCFCFVFLFSQANTFDHMFRAPEGFPAWPLLLPSENISKITIVAKADLSAPSASPDLTAALSSHLRGGAASLVEEGSELLPGREDSAPLPLDDVGVSPAAGTGSSAQSLVTYATVLLCDPKQQQLHHLHDKDGVGCSSSDEGNFSANNSDSSGSFPGGLWKPDASRHFGSYNSVEELSETSEHSDRMAGGEKDLYYLGLDYGDDDGDESEEEEEPKAFLQNIAQKTEGSVESCPLLEPTNSRCDVSALYLPQFRTGLSSTRQLSAQAQGGQRQLWLALTDALCISRCHCLTDVSWFSLHQSGLISAECSISCDEAHGWKINDRLIPNLCKKRVHQGCYCILWHSKHQQSTSFLLSFFLSFLQ